MPEELINVYYLVKDTPLVLRFNDIGEVTFAPNALVTKSNADNLLGKVMTYGGCCGKPSKTLHIFATEEQLASGQRKYIE